MEVMRGNGYEGVLAATPGVARPRIVAVEEFVDAVVAGPESKGLIPGGGLSSSAIGDGLFGLFLGGS